jgi:hypothetical protein
MAEMRITAVVVGVMLSPWFVSSKGLRNLSSDIWLMAGGVTLFR